MRQLATVACTLGLLVLAACGSGQKNAEEKPAPNPATPAKEDAPAAKPPGPNLQVKAVEDFEQLVAEIKATKAKVVLLNAWGAM